MIDTARSPLLGDIDGLARTVRAREWDAFEGFEQSRTGLYLPVSDHPMHRLVGERPTAMDFFAGAGGFSLGFHEAGWHVIAASEWDCAAATTYLCNLGGPSTRIVFVTDDDRVRMEKFTDRETKRLKKAGSVFTPTWGEGWLARHPGAAVCEVFFLGDIRLLTGERILDALDMERGELGCVMGGPPCQGFSTAGRRNVYDPRNSLVFEYARLICELRPSTMLMENVPNILNMVTPEGIPVVDQFCAILEAGEMGTYDALRKSMFPDAGRRAAVRGTSKASAKGFQKGSKEAAKQEAKTERRRARMAKETGEAVLDQLAMSL